MCSLLSRFDLLSYFGRFPSRMSSCLLLMESGGEGLNEDFIEVGVMSALSDCI